MRLIIKNGHLIDPKNRRNGRFDLLIEEGKVRDILKAGHTVASADVIDAKGCIVSPGFIDLHVHLREPGYEYKETIRSGTLAAAAGGFTSVCCMANTNPVNDNASITEYILKKAKEEGTVNVFPIGALSRGLAGKELSPMGELKKAGCVGFSDDGKTVQNSRLMRLALEYAKTFDAPVISHAICSDLAHGGVMHEGFVATKLGLPGIPSAAEDIIISRDIRLAETTGARLHIAHLSTAEGVELVQKAKKKGIRVTAEATPHHFTLTDETVEAHPPGTAAKPSQDGASPYDTNTKIMPPLRSEKDRRAIVEGLATGVIDAIATDHAPHALVDKEIEFDSAAFGIVGLETALSLSLQLVEKKKLTMKKMVELLTINPARIVGLKKGGLEPGASADVVIFNPSLSCKIDPAKFYSKSKNTPFGGMKVKGVVKYTIVGGKVIYQV
ncbi:MAG: dihydroorotase [Deltaproteobacteria bacterium]|nr:dihydroorotase [Deltaproteobacteria bacterium]